MELLVVQQYHDEFGRMDVDNTYDVIRQKYLMPNIPMKRDALYAKRGAFRRLIPTSINILPFPKTNVGLNLLG